jgi:hypothetical protein
VGTEVKLHILYLGKDVNKLLTTSHLYTQGEDPGTVWTEGWVGFTAGLDAVEN